MSSLWGGFVYDVLLGSVAVNIPQLYVRWKQPRREMLLSGPKPLFTHRVSLALVTSLFVSFAEPELRFGTRPGRDMLPQKGFGQ